MKQDYVLVVTYFCIPVVFNLYCHYKEQKYVKIILRNYVFDYRNFFNTRKLRTN